MEAIAQATETRLPIDVSGFAPEMLVGLTDPSKERALALTVEARYGGLLAILNEACEYQARSFIESGETAEIYRLSAAILFIAARGLAKIRAYSPVTVQRGGNAFHAHA